MKYFDDLHVSGTIFSSGEEVAIKNNIATEIELTKNEFCAKIDSVVESVSNLREELLGEDESLKSTLEGKDIELQGNIDSLSFKLDEHVNENVEKFEAIENNISDEITRATKAEEGLQGQITADVEALISHQNNNQNPHKVTLSQLLVEGAYVEIPAGEVDQYCCVKIVANDVNRNENNYVFEISPEILSLSSGNSKLVFSDGTSRFTSVVSGVAGNNADEFIIKSQLDNEVRVLDEKIDTTKSNLESLIDEKISSETHFDFDVVTILPETGVKGVIYLVPKNSGGESQNIHEEYIWNDKDKVYEKIGDTRVDLTPYYTSAQVDEKISKVENDLVSEAQRASEEEAKIRAEVASSIEQAINQEVINRDLAITKEVEDRNSADEQLRKDFTSADTLLNTEISRRINTLETSVNKHITDFEAKANEIETRVGVNETSISGINIGLSSVNKSIEDLKAKDTEIETAYKAADEVITEGLGVATDRISALEEGVKSLSTKEEVAVVSGKVDTNTSKISTLEGGIASINATIPTLATKSEVEAVNAKVDSVVTKDYVDAGDVSTLRESKEYTDQVKTEAITTANTYTDSKISSGLVTQDQLSDAILTAKTYSDSADIELAKNLVSKTLDNVISGTNRFTGSLFYGESAIDDNEVVVKAELNIEKESRIASDEQLQESIDAEVSRATATEGLIDKKIDDEKARAEAEEARLGSLIDGHEERLASVEGKASTNETAISKEALDRESADEELQNQITALESAPAKREIFSWDATVDGDLSKVIDYTIEPTDGMVMVQVYKDVSGIMSLVICDVSNDIANKQVTISLNELKEDTTFKAVIM